jgi:hypothetical protein
MRHGDDRVRGAPGTDRQRSLELEPWMLFAFPAVIVTVIISGFMLGGPIVGFLAALVVAGAIVTAAIRLEPHRQQGTAGRTRLEGAPDHDRDWRGPAAKRFSAPLAIAAAGIVLIVAFEGTTRAVGWGVLAIAITVAMSLVFLEIGYSEDRARAREQRTPARPRAR